MPTCDNDVYIPFRLPLAFYDEDTLMLFVAVKVGMGATTHTHACLVRYSIFNDFSLLMKL